MQMTVNIETHMSEWAGVHDKAPVQMSNEPHITNWVQSVWKGQADVSSEQKYRN